MKQIVSALLAVWAFLPLAAQQHLPSNDDLRKLRVISEPHLSPDGKSIVALVQDSTAEGGRTHLWLLSTGNEGYRQLTFSKADPSKPDAVGAGERQPEYLPDGSAILFVAHRDSVNGLFRLPMNGGEAVPVKVERVPAGGDKPSPVDVSNYSISPDGRTVAVIATDPQPASHERDVKERRDVRWVEHDDLKHRLYLVDTKDWKATEVPRLTQIASVAWHDSSDRLLVLTDTQPRDLGPSSAGWLLSVANPGTQTRVAGLPITTRRAVWMHHADELLIGAQCAMDAPVGCADLYTFDLATAKTRNLTAGLKDSTISLGTVVVADDDRHAIVSVTRGMHATAAEVDLVNAQIRLLDLGVPVATALRQNPTKTGWVYEGSSSTQPPAINFTSDVHRPATQIATPELTPGDWIAVPSRPVSWRRAGLTIEGLLYMPPQAKGVVPLIVNVHGGPTGQFTDSWSPLTNLLLAQGWAVLITNPRGSTGYGVEFEAANKNDMGNGDFLDIMAGVDEVARTAPVDSNRLALIGYSYGGEMAGFVEGKTDRFKAVVSGAPVIDQFSEYGTENDSFGDRWFTGQPWLHFESAWRQSPLAYAGHAKTPFLLLQGESDPVDPEGQSLEMYRALRQEGVPVHLLLFPREDHAALGGNFAGRPSTEPWAGVIARQHMIDFIRDAFAGKVEPVQQ